MQSKQVWQTQITERAASDIEGVGNTRIVGDKVYRWVLNEDASNALVKGQSCCHVVANTTTLFHTVQKNATASLFVFAGIVASTDGLAAYVAGSSLSYGWIQIYGFNSDALVMNAATPTFAVGDNLIPVNAATYVTRQTAGTAAANRRKLILLEEVATATTTELAAAAFNVLVDCI